MLAHELTDLNRPYQGADQRLEGDPLMFELSLCGTHCRLELLERVELSASKGDWITYLAVICLTQYESL